MERMVGSTLNLLKNRMTMPGRIRPIPMATEATKSGLNTSAVLGNMIDQMTPATTKMVPITTLTTNRVFVIISFLAKRYGSVAAVEELQERAQEAPGLDWESRTLRCRQGRYRDILAHQ